MASYDRKTQQQTTTATQTVEGEDTEATYGNAAAATMLPGVEDESTLLDTCGDDTGIEVVMVDINAVPEWAVDAGAAAMGTSPMVIKHVYVRSDDGWSAGFTEPAGGGAIAVQIPEPRAAEAPSAVIKTVRQPDEVSQAMTSDELKETIQANAAKTNPGKYDALGNNCGDFVRELLDGSHLMSVIPHLSGSAGDLTASQHPYIDAGLQAVTDSTSEADGEDVYNMRQGAATASSLFAGA
jgi:hypothetical protein